MIWKPYFNRQRFSHEIPYARVDVTIAITESLSGAVDCNEFTPLRISFPATFEGTSITFQTSLDGVTYQNLYNADGEVEISIIDATDLILDPALGITLFPFFKIRSGTAAAPAAVAAARTLGILGIHP